MIARHDIRSALALFLAISFLCRPAEALVTLNDGHDHIYVTGSAGLSWDSNLTASSGGASDYAFTSSILAEYQRHAGWIGVNGSVQVDASRYQTAKGQNFSDPKFELELTKKTGRTTGSLTLNAARQSRADAAVNVRTTSWNYDAGLNFHYPIIGTNSVAGKLGYSSRKYIDNVVFANLSTYVASLDYLRLLSNERDLMIGYRYRHEQTSLETSSVDHNVTAGLSGKLIRGLNGSMRFGYQVRIPHGTPAGSALQTKPGNFKAWTASIGATHDVNKRLSLTGSLSKDFSTTATDTSVDALAASLDAQYAFSSHWKFGASGSYGQSNFLGEAGRVVISAGPPAVLGRQRRDDYLTWSLNLGYSLNEHLKADFSYTWFENWSTIAFADFVRTSYNMNLSSRW
jgi:hypothetical protein